MFLLALFLATLPIAGVTVLLLLRVSPPVSSFIALTTGIVELTYFPTPLQVIVQGESVAIFTATEVAMIILGGILFYEVIKLCGIDHSLASWLTGISSDRERLAILMVLGMTPFMESVTGFGVGAIFAVPLLQRVGFDSRRAAIIGLLGYVAVPWGALGPGTLVAARLTGLSFHSLGVVSALISLPIFLVVGIAALIVAGNVKSALKKLDEVVLLSLSLWIGIVSSDILLGTPLAGVLGSVVSTATGIAIIHVKEGRGVHYSREVFRIIIPYSLLVGLLLTSQAIVYVTGFLFPAVFRGIPVLRILMTSPATWLMAASLLTAALFRQDAGALMNAGRDALRRWWKVAFTTFCFLALGSLMAAAGMTSVIADSLGGLGTAGYLSAVPFIGALGGLLTGSNTGANAMFAQQQAEVASRIGYPKLMVVGVQNVCASLFTMSSGSRIQLVSSLFPEHGRELSIFRTIFSIDLIIAGIMAILLVILPLPWMP